jgi:DNA-binding NarL/FixJ family response regulator
MIEAVKVLVVDGSAAVGVRLVGRLREAGLEVVGLAASVDAAHAQVGMFTPDVLVLDPELPDRGGLELVAVAKARVPALLVVIVTNDPHPGYRRHCESLGADFFFDKSTEFDAMAAALVRAAGARPL